MDVWNREDFTQFGTDGLTLSDYPTTSLIFERSSTSKTFKFALFLLKRKTAKKP